MVFSGLELPSVDFKELLENEKINFELVNSAIAYLGGVPAMITAGDMSNTIPNEKVNACLEYISCSIIVFVLILLDGLHIQKLIIIFSAS